MSRYSHALTLSIILCLTSACSLVLPVHDGHPPQTLGAGGLRVATMTSSSPAIIPDVPGFSSTSIDGDDTSDLAMGYSFGVGLMENLDLEMQLLASFFSGGTNTYALKYQFLGNSLSKSGAGDHVASIKIGYLSSSGYEDDPTKFSSGDSIFNDNVFVEKLEASGYSASTSYGYQMASWAGAYIGGKYLDATMDAVVRDGGPTGTLSSDTRKIEAYGPFIGIALVPHWKIGQSNMGFELTMELYSMNMPGAHTDKRIWRSGNSTAMGLFFDFN